MNYWLRAYHASTCKDTNRRRECKINWRVSLNKNRARELAKQFGSKHFVNYRYLLDDKDIDIINICTLKDYHSEISTDSIFAGKHVCVEKSIAINLRDTDKIISIAKFLKRKKSVVIQNRFNPNVKFLHNLFKSRELGMLILSNATVRWYRP